MILRIFLLLLLQSVFVVDIEGLGSARMIALWFYDDSSTNDSSAWIAFKKGEPSDWVVDGSFRTDSTIGVEIRRVGHEPNGETLLKDGSQAAISIQLLPPSEPGITPSPSGDLVQMPQWETADYRYRVEVAHDTLRMEVVRAVLNLFIKDRFFERLSHDSVSTPWTDVLLRQLTTLGVRCLDFEVQTADRLPDETIFLNFIERSNLKWLRVINMNGEDPQRVSNDFFKNEAVKNLVSLMFATNPENRNLVECDITDEALSELNVEFAYLERTPKLTLQGIRGWLKPVIATRDDKKELFILPSFRIDEDILFKGMRTKFYDGGSYDIETHDERKVIIFNIDEKNKLMHFEAKIRLYKSL